MKMCKGMQNINYVCVADHLIGGSTTRADDVSTVHPLCRVGGLMFLWIQIWKCSLKG